MDSSRRLFSPFSLDWFHAYSLLCSRVCIVAKQTGFMELGETIQEAAKREAREEANAHIEITSLMSIFEVPRIGQIHMW